MFSFSSFEYYFSQSHVDNHYNNERITEKSHFLQNWPLVWLLIRFSPRESSKMQKLGKILENRLISFKRNIYKYILKMTQKMPSATIIIYF